MLDDALDDTRRVAHEPAIRHVAIGHGREQREPRRRLGARAHQHRDPIGLQQRRVAGEDRDDAIVGLALQRGQRALHGVAGAALLGLDRDVDCARTERSIERRLHLFGNRTASRFDFPIYLVPSREHKRVSVQIFEAGEQSTPSCCLRRMKKANPALTPLYMVAPASTAIGDTSTKSAGGNTIGPRILHATVAINGKGSAQDSTVAVASGIEQNFAQ